MSQSAPTRPVGSAESLGSSISQGQIREYRGIAQRLEKWVVNTITFQFLVIAYSAVFFHMIFSPRIGTDNDEDEAKLQWYWLALGLSNGLVIIYLFELLVRFESQAGHPWRLRSYTKFCVPMYHKLELAILFFIAVRNFSFYRVMIYLYVRDELYDDNLDGLAISSDGLMLMLYRAVRLRNTLYRVSVQRVEAKRKRIEMARGNKRWMSDYRKDQRTLWKSTHERLRRIADDNRFQAGLTMFIIIHCATFSFTRDREKFRAVYSVTEYTGYCLTIVLMVELYVRMRAQGGAEQFLQLWFHCFEALVCLISVTIVFYTSFWTNAALSGDTRYNVSGFGLCIGLLLHRILRWLGIHFSITASQLGHDSLLTQQAIAYFNRFVGDIIEIPPPNLTVNVSSMGAEFDFRVQKATLKVDSLKELHLPIILRGALLEDMHIRIKGVRLYKSRSINTSRRSGHGVGDTQEFDGATTDVTVQNLILIFGPGKGLAEAGGLASDIAHWEYESVLAAKAALIDLVQKRLPSIRKPTQQAPQGQDRAPKLFSFVRGNFKKFISEKARLAKSFATSIVSNAQVDILGVTVEFADNMGELDCGHVLAGLEVGHVSFERKSARMVSGVVSRLSVYLESPPEASGGSCKNLPAAPVQSSDRPMVPAESIMTTSASGDSGTGSRGMTHVKTTDSAPQAVQQTPSTASKAPALESRLPKSRWKDTLLGLLSPPASSGKSKHRFSGILSHKQGSLSQSWTGSAFQRISTHALTSASSDEVYVPCFEDRCVKEFVRRRRQEVRRFAAVEGLLSNRGLTDRSRHSIQEHPFGGAGLPGRPGLLFAASRISIEGGPKATPAGTVSTFPSSSVAGGAAATFSNLPSSSAVGSAAATTSNLSMSNLPSSSAAGGAAATTSTFRSSSAAGGAAATILNLPSSSAAGDNPAMGSSSRRSGSSLRGSGRGLFGGSASSVEAVSGRPSASMLSSFLSAHGRRDEKWQWSVDASRLSFATDEEQARFLRTAAWCVKHWFALDNSYRWRPSLGIAEMKLVEPAGGEGTRQAVRLWWIYAMQRVLAAKQKKQPVLWVEVAWHTANMRQYRQMLTAIVKRKRIAKGSLMPRSADEARCLKQLQVNLTVAAAIRIRREVLGMQSTPNMGAQDTAADLRPRSVRSLQKKFRRMLSHTSALSHGESDESFADPPEDSETDDEDVGDIPPVASQSIAHSSPPTSLQVIGVMLEGDWCLRCPAVQIRLVETNEGRITITRPGNPLLPTGKRHAYDEWQQRRALLLIVINGITVDGRVGPAPAFPSPAGVSGTDTTPIAAPSSPSGASDDIHCGATLTINCGYIHCPDREFRRYLYDGGKQVVTVTRYVRLGALPPPFVASSQEGEEVAWCSSVSWSAQQGLALHMRTADVRVVMSEPLVLFLHSRYLALSKESFSKESPCEGRIERSQRLQSQGLRSQGKHMSWRAVPPAPDGVQRRTSGRLHASLVRKGLLKTSSAAAYYVASLHSDEQNRMRGRFDAAAAEAAAMRSVKKRWRMYDRLLGYMGISTDMRIGVEMGSLDFIQVGDYRRGAVVVERYRWYPFDGEWQRKQLSEDEVVKQVLSDACSDLVEESYRTVPFFDKQCMADYDFKRLRCRELSFRASGFKDPREESTVLVNVEPKPLREDARCGGNTNADVIVKEMPRRTWFLQPPQLYDCGTCCGNQVDDAEHFPVQSRPEPDSTSEPAVEVPVEELPIPEHISIVPIPAKAFGPSNVPASLEYRVDAVPHEAIASHWLCEDSAGWCRRVQQKRQTTLYTPTE